MALLKGNKRNKLDTWRFRRENKGRVSSVKVKENPLYRVTITYTNGNDTPKISTKEFHSTKSVDKILRQAGFRKATYPTESVYYTNDTYVKKRKIKGSSNGFIEKI